MNSSYFSDLRLPQPNSTMNSTNASSSNPSKKIKQTIIPPRQLFVNISSDEEITTTPSPTTTSSSPNPPNAPSKTPSTNQTSSSQDNTSSSFQSKLQISLPSSNEPTTPQPLNPLLENILDKPSTEEPRINQEKDDYINSTNNINTTSDGNSTNNVNAVSSTVNATVTEVNAVDPKTSIKLLNDLNMPELEDIVYSNDDEDVGAEANMNNLDAFMPVSPILTTRIHKDHPVDQIIRDLNSAPQTRRMTKNLKERGLFSLVQQRTNHKDFQNCLFACFLSQEESKKVIQALKDPSWIEAMQDELLQFKLQKKDERGIVIKNKAKLVAQGYTQEEMIDYDEVFAPVARIEEIRLFLAYASFKDFVVYQMDVKSAFLYGKIEEEVYVCQPPGFEDPDFPDRVYVDDIIFGSTKKKLCTEFKKMMHKKFPMSFMGELTFFLGLQMKQKEDGIFISQDKYVTEILKKFGFSDVKTANTPMETHKPFLKDADGEDVDEHMYRSMIGSLMYLTSSRPDIMFAICVCARFQVNHKVSHLHAGKIIFRYLKGQPKLGLWYPKDLPFDLVAYTDSDYVGASLDRKSTTGGCQFLGCRLISWQCKKQIVVANSITEAEYVAASSCYGQVLWIQNQFLDYGYNFMHTKIYIDNESTICIVKNPVFHSKIKKIEIRHHFIRDSNEKKLIQMIKIHTDKNVADLLTKAFDATTKVKTVNGEVQFQALVDGKKVIITKTSERRDLQLEDAEGIEFFMDKQVGDMSTHNETFVIPSHTKQVFSNMKRVGKGFSGVVTPLFPTMMVQAQEKIEPIADEAANEENVPIQSNDPPLSRVNTLGSGDDRLKLKELMDLCTKLSDRVLDLETTKTAQAKEIASLKKRVKNLERKRKSKTPGMKRLFKIGRSAQVVSSEDEGLGDQEDASKQGRKIDDIDQDAEVTLVDENQGRYDVAQMFDTYVFNGEEVFVTEQSEKVVEEVVSTAKVSAAATITT
ncbi:putative ribonuclease H-like domain-containing protein [Tanacetum coccineum]